MSETPTGRAPEPDLAPKPSRGHRIVAELGRPETPEETAARKAESSRKHRSNQTLFNLVFALVACLAVVLVLVLVVARPTPDSAPSVDYHALAAETQPTVSEPLASPVLSSRWKANAAKLNTGRDGVTTWYIGFLTPGSQYIGLKQGIDANPSWVSTSLDQARQSGTQTIAGVEWTVYDQRATAGDKGNFAYSLSGTIGGSTYLLYGSASTAEFRTLATALTRTP